MMDGAVVLLGALLLDAALGEPRWLWSRLPHPAVLMGRAIGFCDKAFNRGHGKQLRGVVCVAGLCAVAGAIGWAVAQVWWLSLLAAAILFAQRSLVDHVRAVADGLRESEAAGRLAVSMIVGRDVAELRTPGIARAAIESAAENFSDGVIAPIFWFAIGGLPGLMIYKLVNTADSMIGYRTPRHLEFGWAAARLDDVLNWIPARITAGLILLVSGQPGGWKHVPRDAPLHRSPNAGWPEAAMAVVLNVALAGPRSYGGKMTEFPFVYPEGALDIGHEQIVAATGVLWRAWGLVVMMTGGLAIWMH